MQVFLNLVLNAIDATDRGGRIELRRVPRGGICRCACATTAPASRRTTPAALFQPYFTTKKHGTGLGLFVTRKLVADHGGSVEFESQPAEGTVFRVRLPLLRGEDRAASPLAEPSAALEAKQSSVLGPAMLLEQPGPRGGT